MSTLREDATNFETLAYAMPTTQLNGLLKQFRSLGGADIKRESETVVISAPNGRVVLRALRHTNKKTWLVRSWKGLVEAR